MNEVVTVEQTHIRDAAIKLVIELEGILSSLINEDLQNNAPKAFREFDEFKWHSDTGETATIQKRVVIDDPSKRVANVNRWGENDIIKIRVWPTGHKYVHVINVTKDSPLWKAYDSYVRACVILKMYSNNYAVCHSTGHLKTSWSATTLTHGERDIIKGV